MNVLSVVFYFEKKTEMFLQVQEVRAKKTA